EQDDIAPADEFIGQPLLCRVMHPGAAVQSDDGGKGACAIGLGQIALDTVAPNEPARTEPLRGAFKLDALQRCGPCIGRQRRYGAPKHQHDRGLENDCSRQWRLPRIFVRSRRAKPCSRRVRGASAMMLLKSALQYNRLVPKLGQPCGQAGPLWCVQCFSSLNTTSARGTKRTPAMSDVSLLSGAKRTICEIGRAS